MTPIENMALKGQNPKKSIDPSFAQRTVEKIAELETFERSDIMTVDTPRHLERDTDDFRRDTRLVLEMLIQQEHVRWNQDGHFTVHRTLPETQEGMDTLVSMIVSGSGTRV